MSIRYDISIDWTSSPRLLTVAAPSTELTIQDLLDTCRMLEDTTPGENYEYLISAAGKEPLGGGVVVGITATLNNVYVAFEARPGPDWILCIISGGNLVAEDHLGAELDPRYPTAFTTIDRTASSSATLSELSAIQYSSFGDGVTVDIVNGVAGTAYNIGTLENPVNNIPDAITIANERGFERFHIHGDLILGAGHNVDGFEFEGHSPSKTTITIEDLASTVGCEFQECTMGGILDGNIILDHCVVNTLSYVNGEIRNSRLVGPITLGGGADALFLNCGSAIPTSPPIIDMGGSGQTCVFHDYSGGLNLQNMNGGNYIGVQLDGGKVLIDPTISAGYVIIVGIGLITDNSTGTCVVNTNGLMNTEAINKPVWKECTIDSTSGEAGIAFPLGTQGNPVNNLTDALTICNNNNIEKLAIYTDLTIEASHNINGMSIETHGIMGIDVTLEAGCLADNTVFRYLNLHGVVSNGDVLLVENCSIGTLSGFNGIMQDVTLLPDHILSLTSYTELYNCRAGGEVGSEPEINVGDAILNIHQYRGNLRITDKIGNNKTVIGGVPIDIIIDPSCVNGSIQLLGIGTVTDNSGGSTVIDNMVTSDMVQSIDKKTKLIPGLM